MLADAATFLKNPKLKISEIRFHVITKEAISEFLEFVKSLGFQLDVCIVFINTCDGTTFKFFSV